MTRPNPFILVGWMSYVTSWFLPAANAPDFNVVVPGWKAFRLSACGVLPCEGIEFQSRIYAVLATISVITTLLFMVYSPWLVLRGTRTMQRASAWFVGAAFVFNSHWIVIFGAQGAFLMSGYFLWWLSFLLLAIGLFRSPETKRRELLPSRA